MGIAFALRVAGSEVIEPAHGFAPYGLFAIVVAIVAENFCFGGVGGGDAGASVDEAVRLIEVDGGSDVVGNDGVVLPQFGDAVDLYGEQNGNVDASEFARQYDRGRGSPTVAEEHDVGLRFFLIAQEAIVIAIEKADDGLVGLTAVAIFKDLDESVVTQALAQALGDKHRLLMGIVVANEAANEPDENERWILGMGRNGGLTGE